MSNPLFRFWKVESQRRTRIEHVANPIIHSFVDFPLILCLCHKTTRPQETGPSLVLTNISIYCFRNNNNNHYSAGASQSQKKRLLAKAQNECLLLNQHEQSGSSGSSQSSGPQSGGCSQMPATKQEPGLCDLQHPCPAYLHEQMMYPSANDKRGSWGPQSKRDHKDFIPPPVAHTQREKWTTSAALHQGYA